jgi:hypothetical protein
VNASALACSAGALAGSNQESVIRKQGSGKMDKLSWLLTPDSWLRMSSCVSFELLVQGAEKVARAAGFRQSLSLFSAK